MKLKSLFNKLNTSVRFSNASRKNCSYCNKPFNKELWCYKCDPHCIIEGWTSENSRIDKFIKDTMYYARDIANPKFLEWVPFDKFTDIKQIGEGGFAKVYSATWIVGKTEYIYYNGWEKLDSKPMKVALKRLNGSQNMSDEYLNKLETHWDLANYQENLLQFYGITKDPETKEYMMIMESANEGDLRSILSSSFNKILWKDKIHLLYNLTYKLKHIHSLGYVHKNFHSGNILQNNKLHYISDFGLLNQQNSDGKIYGVLPYIAPEILNGEPYNSSSDIYSFGVVMAELSYGKPPFYERRHDLSLALDICSGFRPEFGKGTPEIYKKLAYRCMDANPNQRPTADKLYNILEVWHDSIDGKFNYKGKEIKAIINETGKVIPDISTSGYIIKAIFKVADNEIPNISTSYEKNPDAVYTSQAFAFNNLPEPINSLYFEEKINLESCIYCYKPFTEKELWCEKCIIQGWTSGNSNIDRLIKDAMYNTSNDDNAKFFEWVTFDNFIDIKQIDEGGFDDMYSATWIDGKAKYNYDYEYESWIKLDSKPRKVTLKRLPGSQNMLPQYFNKLKTYWNLCNSHETLLRFYGITQHPETEEYLIILEFANKGNLRNILSSDCNTILWKDRVHLLYDLAFCFKHLHKLGYFHKDFHSGNILQNNNLTYISDFELSGIANEDKSDDEIHRALSYIAPEVLNGEQHTLSSDIYSFGVIMAEISSGIPPFYNRKHDSSLAFDICNGLRPEFGKETPEFYKRLAYKCMDANPNQRPTADKLYSVLEVWHDSIDGKFNYKGKEIKAIFDEIDKKIPNTLIKYPNAICTNQISTFNNLPKPINPSYFEIEIDYGSCYYCNEPFTEELYCKICDPYCLIEGWTSGNSDIDKFIKDTIYDARNKDNPRFLEWVTYDKFTDVKQIGEGGFAKMYSATWIDGKLAYEKQYDEGWKKFDPKPMEVALKKLTDSQNMSAVYLNELKMHWNIYLKYNDFLKPYGLTKDPETKEFMMIIEFANAGNLRSILTSNFNNILWKDKIKLLLNLAFDLRNLHKLKYFHKDFHSGNILKISDDDDDYYYYISDFGLSGPANEEKSNDKIYGVLPYIAPEVLNGIPYTISSDIYSFGVVMAELSSGIPPFHNRKHDLSLSLAVCNGHRPEYGKGTPEIYKKLAHRCMDANPDQRPTSNELYEIFCFWSEEEEEIKAVFDEADKEIPNISVSYEIDPDAVYTSRVFKPINSSLYLKDEENCNDNQDS